MKSSNLKRKANRFSYSACTLLFSGCVLVSCQDELLTGMPEWLNGSIYEQLESSGNYQRTLELIHSTAIGGEEDKMAETLNLTGSKTLFVADDAAYDRFFQNNAWGVKSIAEMSDAQKKMLFRSSILGSAYLVELLSRTPATGTSDPQEGMCMRRLTEFEPEDSVANLYAEDMPDNAYWADLRAEYTDRTQPGLAVKRDETYSPMVHFLPAFMRQNNITNDDLSFLTNGRCNDIDESYINGQRLLPEGKDIICQNGYVQVLENVPEPLVNMAQMLHDKPQFSTFVKLLDRYAVPVPEDRNNPDNHTYVWRYLNNGYDSNIHALGIKNYEYNGMAFESNEVLPFDPGWNSLYNPTGGSLARDFAVMIAPTNAAFERYFQEGRGAILMEQYGSLENFPDKVVIAMLTNLMKNSFLATIPSKFKTVNNTAQFEMGLEVGQKDGTTGLGAAYMANNGMIYEANQVYLIPEYQSVYFPTMLFEDLSIMDAVIANLDYDSYLKSMDSDFTFVIPTNQALANYLDPVSLAMGIPLIVEFVFDTDPALSGMNRVKVNKVYAAVLQADGTYTKGNDVTTRTTYANGLVAYITGNGTSPDYILNRLTDILDNSIVLSNIETATGQRVFATKNGGCLSFSGTGENVDIISPFIDQQRAGGHEVPAIHVRSEKGYYYMGNSADKTGNGVSYIVESRPVEPTTKSVPTLLQERILDDSRYEEFYHIMDACGVLASEYDITVKDTQGQLVAATCSNGKTISLFENYNYTVYVPVSDEIKKLYDLGILPDYRDIEEWYENVSGLTEKLEGGDLSEREEELINAQIASLEADIATAEKKLERFVRYHLQLSAVYQHGAPLNDQAFETTLLQDGRFSSLRVTNSGNGNISLRCCDETNALISGEEARHVISTDNMMAREYHFRGSKSGGSQCNDISKARYIYNSSFVAVHLIDKPLMYKELYEDYVNAQARR